MEREILQNVWTENHFNIRSRIRPEVNDSADTSFPSQKPLSVTQGLSSDDPKSSHNLSKKIFKINQNTFEYIYSVIIKTIW